MGISEIFVVLADLIFLFFASLIDFSGEVEYRHPQIGSGGSNQNQGNQTGSGGHRITPNFHSNTDTQVRRYPIGGCAGGVCGL
ncbi:Uncharacterized protein QTN25_010042 [Entamoeba marina]